MVCRWSVGECIDVVDRAIPYHGPFVVYERTLDGALPSCSSEYFIDSFALAGRVPHSFFLRVAVRFRHLRHLVNTLVTATRVLLPLDSLFAPPRLPRHGRITLLRLLVS